VMKFHYLILGGMYNDSRTRSSMFDAEKMPLRNILSCFGVTYKTDFGFDDWIFCTLYISGLQAIQRYCYSTQFPVHCCTRTRILSLHQSYPGNGFITVSL
jgi:hypothetical protein